MPLRTEHEANEDVQAEIDALTADGWAVTKERAEWAELKKRHWGHRRIHVLLLLTAGVGNVIYAPYKRFISPDRQFVGDPPGRVRRSITPKNIAKFSAKVVMKFIGQG